MKRIFLTPTVAMLVAADAGVALKTWTNYLWSKHLAQYTNWYTNPPETTANDGHPICESSA
jgi:hypothetical protein